MPNQYRSSKETKYDARKHLIDALGPAADYIAAVARGKVRQCGPLKLQNAWNIVYQCLGKPQATLNLMHGVERSSWADVFREYAKELEAGVVAGEFEEMEVENAIQGSQDSSCEEAEEAP